MHLLNDPIENENGGLDKRFLNETVGMGLSCQFKLPLMDFLGTAIPQL